MPTRKRVEVLVGEFWTFVPYSLANPAWAIIPDIAAASSRIEGVAPSITKIVMAELADKTGDSNVGD